MTRVVMAQGCRELDLPSGRRVYARDYRQGGSFDVPTADVRAIVAAGGAVASLAPGTARRSVGYRCGECGHGSFFTRCGRCGGPCEREAQS